MIIEDARTSDSARVVDGYLLIEGATTTSSEHAQIVHGLAYHTYTGQVTIPSAATPYYAIAMKNTSTRELYTLDHVRVSLDGTETGLAFVEFGIGSGLTAGGTEISSTNLKTNSLEESEVVVYYNNAPTTMTVIDGIWVAGGGSLDWGHTGLTMAYNGIFVVRITTTADSVKFTCGVAYYEYSSHGEE